MDRLSLKEYARDASAFTLGEVACLLSRIDAIDAIGQAPDRWNMHFHQLVMDCEAGNLTAGKQPEADLFPFLLNARPKCGPDEPRKLVYTSSSRVLRADLIDYLAELGPLPDWLKDRGESEQTFETLQMQDAALLTYIAKSAGRFRHASGAPNMASIQAAMLDAVRERFSLPAGAVMPGLSESAMQAYAKPSLSALEAAAVKRGGKPPAGD